MKIRNVGAESLHMRKAGRRDMAKLIVAFRNFTDSPKSNSINVVQGSSSYEFYSYHVKYAVESKSLRPDQIFKVTEIKQLCYFST